MPGHITYCLRMADDTHSLPWAPDHQEADSLRLLRQRRQGKREKRSFLASIESLTLTCAIFAFSWSIPGGWLLTSRNRPVVFNSRYLRRGLKIEYGRSAQSNKPIFKVISAWCRRRFAATLPDVAAYR